MREEGGGEEGREGREGEEGKRGEGGGRGREEGGREEGEIRERKGEGNSKHASKHTCNVDSNLINAYCNNTTPYQ